MKLFKAASVLAINSELSEKASTTGAASDLMRTGSYICVVIPSTRRRT